MFRNQYDTDVTVWSPQGHLHQIDYAMEAVKQGSACLGLTSKKLVVLCGIKRLNVDLAEHQKKVFKIDDHLGIAVAGLTADGRTLARFMRTESLNHKFVYGSQITIGRLVSDVADKKQECTQSYIRRPYGVGLLVAGADVRTHAFSSALDGFSPSKGRDLIFHVCLCLLRRDPQKKGVHLYQTCPSGNYYEYKAIAIGARSQSARTYLEKHFESFDNLGKDELIQHALQGIRGCLQGDQELTSASITIAIVGIDQPFKIIEGDELQPYIDAVEVSDVKDEDGDTKIHGVKARSGADDRFYTPRGSARRGYSSGGSEDEHFVSPCESACSISSDDNEYGTPRESILTPAEQQQYQPVATVTTHSAKYLDDTLRGNKRFSSMSERKQALPEYSDDGKYEHKLQRNGSSKDNYLGLAIGGNASARAFEVRGVQYADAPTVPENDIFSATRHNRVDSATYMMDQGVSVNSKDEFGNTILSIACQNGLKRMAKLALRRGANINSKKSLRFCFAYGYGDTLGAYLISESADTTIENKDGSVCYYGIDQPSAKT